MTSEPAAAGAPSRASGKSPAAFRTIGEASEELGVPQHVLRFWETKFTQLKPMKRAGGRRYYRPEDMQLLGRIRDLLYQEGFTIKGARRHLRLPVSARGLPVAAPQALEQEPLPATAESPDEPEAEEEIEPEDAAPDLAAPQSALDPEEGGPEDGGAEELPAPEEAAAAEASDGGESQRLRAALEELHRGLLELRQGLRRGPPA